LRCGHLAFDCPFSSAGFAWLVHFVLGHCSRGVDLFNLFGHPLMKDHFADAFVKQAAASRPWV
jgi:hypothetical protein